MVHSAGYSLTLAIAMTFVGCAGDQQAPRAASTSGQSQIEGETQEPPLTADQAKQALLDGGETLIPPGVPIPPPKDEPIQDLGAGEIAIGPWRCRLAEKAFEASAHFPEAPRHKFNHISGVFVRDPSGKWSARVTKAVTGS